MYFINVTKIVPRCWNA